MVPIGSSIEDQSLPALGKGEWHPNGTNLRRIWDEIRHSGWGGWQVRKKRGNFGKPGVKATTRGKRVRLTQPVENGCFLLNLALFGTGSFTTLPLTFASLAPLARVCSPARNRFAQRTPSSPRVFGSSFPLGIRRKAITGRVGTGRSSCLFRTVFCSRKGTATIGDEEILGGGERRESPRRDRRGAVERWGKRRGEAVRVG